MPLNHGAREEVVAVGLRAVLYRAVIEVDGHDIPEVTGRNEGTRTDWRLRPVTLEICYGWYAAIGYWKVMGSVVKGKPMTAKAPNEFTWLNHNVTKPMWVTVLEHEHFPRGNPNDRRR